MPPSQSVVLSWREFDSISTVICSPPTNERRQKCPLARYAPDDDHEGGDDGGNDKEGDGDDEDDDDEEDDDDALEPQGLSLGRRQGGGGRGIPEELGIAPGQRAPTGDSRDEAAVHLLHGL